jgi:hypothetical protein
MLIDGNKDADGNDVFDGGPSARPPCSAGVSSGSRG